jgi:hypothetical protein
MSVRTYKANFGNGNGALLLNGSNGSSQWSYANGEIFVGPGSTLNAGAGFSPLISNPAALLLRAGRNLSANGKSLIFRCTSTGAPKNARALERFQASLPSQVSEESRNH